MLLLDPNPPNFPSDAAVAWGEDAYGLWQAIAINGVRQVMRWIPPGQFWMGSPETEPEREDNEPQHFVTLSEGFWLAETACTQALWQAVMGENPAHFNSNLENPVEEVSWDDCQNFIQQTNQQLPADMQLRLPTEAEWEYACRAHPTTDADNCSVFSWGNELTTDLANYDGDFPYADGAKGEDRRTTLPVLSFKPNAWGLYQTHGNVWEWCADWWGDYPVEPVIDPAGAVGQGQRRGLRGGSWYDSGRSLRSAGRDAPHPGDRDYGFGLRLAGG